MTEHDEEQAAPPTDRVCAQCGLFAGEPGAVALVVMEPGLDGEEWALCLRCYSEGTS